MNNSVKNILIVRTDRIGDVVLTLPLTVIIKKHYPECKVSFLVRDYTKDILANHPFVDETIILKEENGRIVFFDNLKQITSRHYDACIVVNPRFTIALILFLSGIKKRIGTGYRLYSFFFNQKVFEHRKYAEKHEVEFNLSLLQKIGIKETASEENISYHLSIDNKSLEYADQILINEKIDSKKPLVIIHPGSGGSSIDLPVEKFIQLTKKIIDDGFQVVITGNTKEMEICRRLVLSNKVKNLAGKFNLVQLIALISRSTVFISNSTGPIHIAAALGKFTVGFYPKILSCSKERWAPYTNKKLIYNPELDCKNCNRKQCEQLNCMESIDINVVYKDIKKVLA
ncbi:MAG: glycosyltransferase family 9 protein [Ignavibacteriaceae bacterium]